MEYEPLAYEDFIANYESTIDGLLARFDVPEDERHISAPPMKKIGNKMNEEFKSRFSDYIHGQGELRDILAG